MNKVLLTKNNVEGLLEWRDNHVELVRSLRDDLAAPLGESLDRYERKSAIWHEKRLRLIALESVACCKED